jgi:hypothetical protein
MLWQEKYFQKLRYTEDQINDYFKSAKRDLSIALKSDISEVVFRFSYDAFIKLGIALSAQNGYKLRSVPGHHIKIIEQISKLLKDKDIDIFGNKMRQMRNSDLYEGYSSISNKDSRDYMRFVLDVFKKVNHK